MDAFWNSAAVVALFHVPTGMEGNRAAEKCFACDKLTHLPTASNVLMLWQEWLTTPAFYSGISWVSRQLGKLEYRLFYCWNKQSSC